MTTATKEKVSQVGFRIEGEFVTEHFRAIVREGNWRSAFEGLKESLIGITDEYVNAILSGQGKLVGTNSVEYVEDDIYEDKEWLENQYYFYFDNVVKIRGDFYKKYAYVESLNLSDCQKALEENDLYSFPINIGGNDYISEFNRMRAKTYCENSTDEVLYSDSHNAWVLLKKVTVDYPFWLEKEEIEQLLSKSLFNEYKLTQKDIEELEELKNKLMNEQILTNNIRSLKEGNNSSDSMLDNYLSNLKESDEFDNNKEKYKERITNQANKKGGWLTLKDTKNKIEYKIPKNPFLRWCLTNNQAYDNIDWNCISPRGVKTGMDDPNHTDWYIFTGLEISETYNSDNDFFSKMRSLYAKKYSNFNFVILTNYGKHKGFEKAEIVHVNSPSEINKVGKNQIVLIPTANPDYEMVARKAAKGNCIVITEVGGKLCHLVTVSREMRLTLLQYEKALKNLPEGCYCTIDMEDGVIEIIDKSIEKVMEDKIFGKQFD